MVLSVHDKSMMFDLLKLKLEELTFDIAVARRMLKLFRGFEGQTQLISHPRQSQRTGLNHRRKLSSRGKWFPVL